MRIFFLLLTVVLTTFGSFAQTIIPNYNDSWEQPIMKKLIAKDPTVIGFGRQGNDKFVNIAIIDKVSKILYWFSCEGDIVEGTQLSDSKYNLLVSKEIDPFQLHQKIYEREIQITDDITQKCRFPKGKIYSAIYPTHDAFITSLIHEKKYDTLKTSIEKLAALYKSNQDHFIRLTQFELRNPSEVLKERDITKYLNRALIYPGSIKVSEHTDSTGSAEFYNKNIFSSVYKAVLDISAAKLYFYHTNQSTVDSISIKRRQILKLIDEGTDVFTLYQNFNLWQLITLDSTVKQLHDYYIDKKIQTKQKKQAEILLASFNGDKDALVKQLHKAEEKVLLKLEDIFGTDKDYIEQYIWGVIKLSTKPVRFGQYTEDKGLLIEAPVVPNEFGPFVTGTETRGETLYELTDQRGNVVSVITDKKIQHSSDGVTVDYYLPDVVKAADYSSFGAPLPGRTFEMKEYRYGYNGKEDDKETGYQDYGFRMYDPNIARFISPDPLAKQYPWYTPYQFAGNSPIANIDLDGAEPKPSITGNQEGQTQLTTETSYGTLHNIPKTTSQTWNWHAGGLKIGQKWNREKQTTDPILSSAGWYSSEDYFDLLSKTDAVKQLAFDAGYTHRVNSTSETKEELSKFVGKGLNENAANYLNAAAWKVGSKANFDASGYCEPTPFNVEDILGLGLLVKAGLETLGSYAVKDAVKEIPLNRLTHIFGKSEHALEGLVTKFGSQEGAFNAVQKAANQALKAGKLTPNAKGILPSGDLGNIINVGGMNVRLIGGRVENGQVILSSFSRKGF